MGLKEYREKRNFKNTAEPEGNIQQKERKDKEHLFFIQKHKASRLHYDFRIEMEGVLRSWAIPKGPSLNPENKRLAILVEDHPIEYGAFEGMIPMGNYGAGTVMLWDKGILLVPGVNGRKETEAELKKMFYQGNIKFILLGEKIRGEFALVKTKRPGGKGNEWLLIKKKDEYAGQADVLEMDRSVISGRNLDEIKASASAENNAVWYSPSTKDIDYKGAIKSQMEHGIKPMLASLAEAPFTDPHWLFEIKWDGYRAIAETNYNSATIYSRNGLSFDQDFPKIKQKLSQMGQQAVFDGEIVVLNDSGIPEFQLIQNYKRTGKGYLAYYIFDLIFLNGHDLSSLPLRERKQILRQILPEDPVLLYSDHVEGVGQEFFKTAKEKGLEGIIAKKSDSRYLKGKRTKDWLKIKVIKQQEAVIAGFTAPKGGRKNFGALVLGLYEGNEFKYIGHTGGGFNEAILQDTFKKLTRLESDHSPFTEVPKTNMPVKWVKPELVCEVKFQEWTADGIMRQPIFLGLREDKNPREVIREVAQVKVRKENSEAAVTQEMRPPVSHKGESRGNNKPDLVNSDNLIDNGKNAILKFGNISFKVSNLNKVLWPEEGYTKRELIEYYDKISDWILPYLYNRPESLRRTPNGIGKKDFFQKDIPSTAPVWLKTEKIYSESNQDYVNYLICNDKATLLYMANLGCIEINPWSSILSRLDYPDYLVIDLDPGQGSTFDQVIEVALATKEVMDKGKIMSYPKTSGSRGIHIYVPLGGKYNYDQAKDFSHIIVSIVNSLLPDLTTIERTPGKRKQPIYLDYLQNRKGQTLAAPYCLRPKPGATVSTPLFWEEVKPGLHPSQFNIETIFDRIEKTGDIFMPVLTESSDIEAALNLLS